jgi:general secretion pathway protein I
MKNAGFTLLEVMIAVAILGIALTSLFGSQSSSVALATETRFNIQAPLLAQMKLAQLQPAEETISDSGNFGDDLKGFKWEFTVEEALFEGSAILQQLDNTLQHLTLVVSWGDGLYSYQIDSYRRSEQ